MDTRDVLVWRQMVVCECTPHDSEGLPDFVWQHADTHAPFVQESFLDEGFILDKKIGVGQPKRIENAKILVANTAMDTDKIKIYGARVRVDSMQKVHSSAAPIQIE